jgi:NAD(P)-dependent dehydrogenase (short-subunit alcohol dehydrogenase family)
VTFPQDGLRDAVVIVTGSAQGIGRAIAVSAARQGARVVVNSRTRANLEPVLDEITEAGGTVHGIQADLRDADQVEALTAETADAYGRIDLLINNAAGLFFAKAEDISPNGWRTVIDTSLTTAFLCCRAAFPYFRRQGGGRILNVSSTAAYHPHAGGAHYAAAKAAMNSLTQTLAVEWAPHGIQVNGVAPGAVRTDGSRFSDPGERAKVEAELPGGHIAAPEEIAEVVLSVATTATSYLNGETVRVDGAHRAPLQRSSVQTTRHGGKGE